MRLIHALLALSLVLAATACDRRETDGQSTLPPSEGAASTEPEPSIDGTQGESPATPADAPAPEPASADPDVPPQTEQDNAPPSQ